MDYKYTVMRLTLLLWVSCFPCLATSDEQTCEYLTVDGIVHNPQLLGGYQITSLECSDKPVFKQIANFNEHFIFYFDADVESPNEDPYNVKPFTELRYDIGKPSKYPSRVSSSESDDSESEESTEDNSIEEHRSNLGQKSNDTIKLVTYRDVKNVSSIDVTRNDAPDSRDRRQTKEEIKTYKMMKWQSQLSGWRIGPISCHPDGATGLNLDVDRGDPTLVGQTWLEYVDYRWTSNQDMVLHCKSRPSVHGHWRFESRQKLGFTIVLCLGVMCIMHSLYKNYRRQRMDLDFPPQFHEAEPDLRDVDVELNGDRPRPTSPSARNHFVILSFPHSGEPSSLNGNLLSASDEDEDIEFVHTGLVQPPQYEEVAVVSPVAAGAPPSYDEVLHGGPADEGPATTQDERRRAQDATDK